MNNILKKIKEGNRQMEKAEADAIQKELHDPVTGHNRRHFLRKTALGGVSLAGLMGLSFEDTIAQTTSRVNRASSPSDF